MKQLPIGNQDFKAVRDSDKYYVDKSMLIGQIIDQNDKGIFLYTRPRRFGKSLNLSMIDAFFNLKYEGNTWFDGLEISRHDHYCQYKNRYPTIYADLRSDESEDYDGFLYSMKYAISNVYKEYNHIVKLGVLSDSEIAQFNKISGRNCDESETAYALADLCKILERCYNRKVIVLIDEYDNAVNNASNLELRNKILSFLRKMLSPLLKGNDSLQIGVITGVMQITKENIFSGLNNLYVNNILKKDYDEMFGFTDAEVRKICEDYGHPEKFIEAKEWYDGYRFGDVDIYNPWSILNYVQERFEPDTYWANTSSNSIINDLLANADSTTMENLRRLGSGESIEHDVTPSITFEDLDGNPDAIYSIMAVSGYLKAISNECGYVLSIPNKELYSVFAQNIYRSAVNGPRVISNLKKFSNAILSGSTDALEQSLYNIISDTLSSRVLDNEHSYQAFIAGLLMNLSGKYEIKADFEAGKGYYDIRMRSKTGTGSNVVIEIKRSESELSRAHDAQLALKQIKEKDYVNGLNGKTVLYGIAFFGKEPLIVSENL